MSQYLYSGKASLFSATALSLVLLCVPEVAAQVALEEITVTARKREESLKDIPLSITALTSQDIANRGVSELRDIIDLTPGLSISEFGAGQLNFPVIRGLTNLTGGAFAENNVSVFYNGVYLANSNMVDVTFLDLERVEVVKGPVSALYGRNAYSGVINYVTKRPSDEFEGTLKLEGGNHDRYGIQGSVSGPIVDGKLGVRLSGRFDSFGGTREDAISGVDFEGYEKKAIQAAFEIDPTESVNILATLYYSNDDYDQPLRVLTTGNCGAPAGAFQTTLCGKVPDFSDSDGTPRSGDPDFELFGNKRELFMATGNVSIDMGAVSLTSVTSYMDGSEGQRIDRDGTGVGRAYPLIGGPTPTINLSTYGLSDADDDAFSQELRLSSNEDENVRWSFGGFYSRFNRLGGFTIVVDNGDVPAGATAIVPFPIGQGDPTNPPFFQDARLKDRELSGFGLVDFDVTEQLTVSAEARWTDQKKFQNQIGSFLIFPSDADGPDGIEGSWDFWSFRFTADYDVTDQTKLYTSAAKGNKAGGFNSLVVGAADLQYDPEVNWTYEAGIKTNFLDGRLGLDAAVFYSDLSSLQLLGFAGVNSAIRNAGSAKAYGFESSVAAIVADGVTFGIGLAYSNPSFKDGAFVNGGTDVAKCANIPACADRIVVDSNGNTGLNLSGYSLPRQSDWQGTLTVDIVQPLTEDWDWTLRGNYRYESKQYTVSPPTNVAYVGSKHRANLRAGVESDQYSVTAYVDNVFNDDSAVNTGIILDPSNFTSPIAVTYDDKRTFGIEARVNF